MSDLHGWITQQVDRVEEVAKAATPGPWTAETHHHRRTNEPVYYEVHPVAELEGNGDGGVTSEADAEHIALHNPAAVLRRCGADRKILADHTALGFDGSIHCDGCGVDYESGPLVENVNDCPTLLALAEGYGLTPEALAGLDRPQRPELKRRGGILPLGIGATADVPPALRGPNWKGRP